jgi:hypothetical protein
MQTIFPVLSNVLAYKRRGRFTHKFIYELGQGALTEGKGLVQLPLLLR